MKAEEQAALEEILTPQAIEKSKAFSAEMAKKMSPPGGLNLSELLEKRRFEFQIPDRAFDEQPIFDRVHIWQISAVKGETYGDTGIFMPESAQRRERENNPRGVLIAAGPAALDALRSNGVELGHLVAFIQLAPFRMSHGYDEQGKEDEVIVLSASDVTGSRDLRQKMLVGDIRFKPVEYNGQMYTTVVDGEDNPWFGRSRNPRFVGEEV